jgi:ABC-type polysaccharide/polyol phosphate transport system ATPase subunit
LDGVGFKINKGESVGIVGRNGSGKSTLLSIIAGTLAPTRGSVCVRGKVAAILQLGSGFNHEYTGRENVVLNASIFGLSQQEIEERMEAILSFADIGEFVDQPVKTYSSGMRMRLSFAVLTAVNPDVLIVDEALSVGDAFFRLKCTAWLDEFISGGRTFICVSHDMYLLRRLCQRGLVLERGKLLEDSSIREASNHYYHLMKGGAAPTSGKKDQKPATGNLNDGAGRNQLRLNDRIGNQWLEVLNLITSPSLEEGVSVDEWVSVKVEFMANEDVDLAHFSFGLRDRKGLMIGGIHGFWDEEINVKDLVAGSRYCLSFKVKMALNPGIYLLVMGFSHNQSPSEWTDIDTLLDCVKVVVSGDRKHWGLQALPQNNFECQLMPSTSSS